MNTSDAFLSFVQPHEVRIAGSSAIHRIFGSCEDRLADYRNVIFEEQESLFVGAEC
jgi:hypothetical protein